MAAVDTQAQLFSVKMEPSGRVFETAADETVLAAGVRQSIGLPYGCKDGACGSCKCKMLSGTVVHKAHQVSALSPEEEARGMILTCCATAQTDLVLESQHVTQAGAWPIKKLPTRVRSLDKVSPDVMLLSLELPANDAFHYHAGQYVDFLLRDGARRSYSMANAPSDAGTIELHIRHMLGGKFTDHVFGVMKERDILRMEGPFGSFYLREDSTLPIILLASGTGFAPIKAILEYMQTKGIERSTTLYWGGNKPSDLYLDAWVKAFATANPWLHYIPVVSDAQAQDQWQGRTGFVHLAVLQDFADLSGHQVYACGAPIVVASAHRDFVAQAKLPQDAFFSDAFTSLADKSTAAEPN